MLAGIGTKQGSNPRPWTEAFLDALLVFGYVFLATLAVGGYPPTIAVVYTSAIASGIAFMASLAAWRRLSLPARA